MNRTKKILAGVLVGILVLGVVKLVPRTKEVYIIGEINYNALENLRKDLSFTVGDYINNPKKLIVHINSPGGLGSAMIEMITLLDEYPAKEKFYIGNGEVCSAGAIILICGQKGHRFLQKNALFMVHLAAVRTPFETIKKGFGLEHMNYLVVRMLSNKTGKSRAEILRLFSVDNYMTPEQALKYGLIDSIVGEDTENLKEAPLNPEFEKYIKTRS